MAPAFGYEDGDNLTQCYMTRGNEKGESKVRSRAPGRWQMLNQRLANSAEGTFSSVTDPLWYHSPIPSGKVVGISMGTSDFGVMESWLVAGELASSGTWVH